MLKKKKEYTGKKFDRLLVLKDVGRTKGGGVIWECVCDCGNHVNKTSGSLSKGGGKSCGCHLIDKYTIIGQRFGKLTVVSQLSRGKRMYCECVCDCGNIVFTRKDGLKNSTTNQCKDCRTRRVICECSNCGKKLERVPSQAKGRSYCRRECESEWVSKNRIGEKNHAYKGGKTKKECAICGSEFDNWPSDNNKYCSRECYAIYLTRVRGEDHPLWKNADFYQKKRRYPEYKKWRTSVFERDDFTCQCCDKRGDDLQAHHIVNFSLLYNEDDNILYDIDNGITFCKKCHKKFHSKYGKLANNKDQVRRFISSFHHQIN